jgi:hypothetical protein
MPRLKQRTIARDVVEWNRFRQKLKCPSDADDVDLRKRRLWVRLLFGGFSFVYNVAKRTRMRSIEGAFHRLAKRRALRVLNHHRRPGDRLQRNPLQADRAAKREDHDNTADAVKHIADAIGSLPVRQTAEIGQANLGG